MAIPAYFPHNLHCLHPGTDRKAQERIRTRLVLSFSRAPAGIGGLCSTIEKGWLNQEDERSCPISGACLALGRVVTEHPKLSGDPSTNVHTAALQTSSDKKHSVCCVHSGILIRVFLQRLVILPKWMDVIHKLITGLCMYSSVFTQLSLATTAPRFLCREIAHTVTLTLSAEMALAPCETKNTVILLTFLQSKWNSPSLCVRLSGTWLGWRAVVAVGGGPRQRPHLSLRVLPSSEETGRSS